MLRKLFFWKQDNFYLNLLRYENKEEICILKITWAIPEWKQTAKKYKDKQGRQEMCAQEDMN